MNDLSDVSKITFPVIKAGSQVEEKYPQKYLVTTQETTQQTTQETTQETVHKTTQKQYARIGYPRAHPYLSRKERAENMDGVTVSPLDMFKDLDSFRRTLLLTSETTVEKAVEKSTDEKVAERWSERWYEQWYKKWYEKGLAKREIQISRETRIDSLSIRVRFE